MALYKDFKKKPSSKMKPMMEDSSVEDMEMETPEEKTESPKDLQEIADSLSDEEAQKLCDILQERLNA